MTRNLLLAALAFIGLASTASAPAAAMDAAERTRQMELFNAHQTTGVGIVTKTTEYPAAAPVATPAATAPAAPVQENAASTDATFTAGRKSQQQRELEAYQAWKAGQQPAVKAPAAPVATLPATPHATATTTTEKTTATNYTVTTRKVGMVGGRPYPATKSELTGGVVRETSVNGTPVSQEVVVKDAVAGMKDKPASGDYYSSEPAAKAYKGTVGNVRVHKTGRFN